MQPASRSSRALFLFLLARYGYAVVEPSTANVRLWDVLSRNRTPSGVQPSRPLHA